MPEKLHYKTITPLLLSLLKQLMSAEVFAPFRLVGGTALSLQRGHRQSVDIDLFTDAPYDSINFTSIEKFLKKSFQYVDTNNYALTGMGKSYYVGKNKDNCIKLDIFYTDAFLHPARHADGLRMAHIEDIIAMKVDVISRGGRKKDFWDIHELMEDYPASLMFDLHSRRHVYTHDPKLLKAMFINFTEADSDFDPECLHNKHWELIKMDIIDFIKGVK